MSFCMFVEADRQDNSAIFESLNLPGRLCGGPAATMIMGETSDWRERIKNSLNEQQTSTEGWKAVVQRDWELLDIIETLQKKAAEQNIMLEEAERVQEQFTREIGRLKNHYELEEYSRWKERIAEVEGKLEATRQELTDSYKQKSENAQRLLSLNDELYQKNDELAALRLQVQELTIREARLRKEVEACTMQKDLDKATILKSADDSQALNLELNVKDRELRQAQEDVRRLISENNMLAEQVHALHKEQTDMRSRQVEREKDWTVVDDFKTPSKAQKMFRGHDREVLRACSDREGSLVVTAGLDRHMNLWESQTGERTQSLGPVSRGVLSVALDSSRNLLVGTTGGGTASVWNLRTARNKVNLVGHIGSCTAAVFSGNGSKVITGSVDRTLKIYDLNRAACLRTFFAFSSCYDLVVADEQGMEIISGHLDGHLRLWDQRVKDGENQPTKELSDLHTAQITATAISPNRTVVLTNSRDNSLKLVDLRMLKAINTFGGDGYKTSGDSAQAAFSPGGDYIAAGSENGTVYVWDTATSRVVSQLKMHTSAVNACAWNWSTGVLLTADKDKNVCLWE